MNLETNQPPKKEEALLPFEQDRLRQLKNAFLAVNPKVQRAFKKQLLDGTWES